MSAMTFHSINPMNGKVLGTFEQLSDRQLEDALTSAHTCFSVWSETSFPERAVIGMRAAGLLRTRTDEFARLATLEMGKLYAQARAEVLLSANIIEYYARNAAEFLAPERLNAPNGEAEVVSEPLGVLLGIQPWNFPYYQPARFAGPNLMAGNVVLVKHAAVVPQCAIAFEQLWREAGAPVGAYTNLLISHEQAERVIDDPRVKGVALTGGIESARDVAARAGKNIKKTTLELGGDDPFIVLEDADLDKTVKWAVWAKMNNDGQCCVAAKRFIVVESVAGPFLAKFQAALEALKPGSPMDKRTTLGPMSSENGLRLLLSQVDSALQNGARLVMGGKRMDREGAFMTPTILTDIAISNPAYWEEFFGPVALFFSVANEEEAIQLANTSDYGLGGAVFTRDVARGKRVAHRLHSGMVFVNHPTWTSPELPFGGINNSGYGRELSRLGIQEFINKKLIRVQPIDAPV